MSHILDFSGFTPHGFCLAWQPGLIWLTAISNMLIAVAYFSIPAALAALLVRFRDFEYMGVVGLFAAFILACGTTHVFEALTLWVPLYWVSGILDAVTAVLSIATAIILWPLIPKFLSLPSPTTLQRANLRLQAAEAATARTNRWLTMSEQLANVGHWRQTRGDNFMIWSDELFRIFGIEPSDWKIGNDVVHKAWHPDDWDAVRKATVAALRGKTGFTASGRIIRPSGEVRHVRVRGEIKLDRNGDMESLFGICIDRTEQAVVEQALERARAEAEAAKEHVEKLALQDSLTGLANRRQFDQALSAEFQRARRIGNHLSLIMLDVDNFKHFNDDYGHLAGDDCLREIAKVISGPLHRAGDLAARYGGEEFAVILPGTDLAAARQIAWRIVESVRRLTIQHVSNAGGTVTISAGVASLPAQSDHSDPVQLIEWADGALYTAKMNGRDRAYARPAPRAATDPVQATRVSGVGPSGSSVAPIESAPVRHWSPTHVLRSDVFGSAPDSGFDLSTVLDALPYAAILTDATRPEQPIACVNAAFSDLTGYQKQDAIGRDYRLFCGPETDPMTIADLNEAMKQGVSLRRELLSYRKNGTSFCSEVYLTPLRDASGQLFGFMLTQRDTDAARPAPAEMDVSLARIVAPSETVSPKISNSHQNWASPPRERQFVVLQRSLQRGCIEAQFALLYHPLVDLNSGRILGAEALLRWNHPQLGVQRPDSFIPLAEASGLIVPLGAWVFRTALAELQAWQSAGGEDARISVNVSSVQLRDPGFIAMIDDALAQTRIDPGRIDLELTESVLIEANVPTLAVLDALKARGFRLALDDFGTGYSSFRCLQDLPIDLIKIDQTFVRRVTHDTGEDSIVRAMLSVTKRLGVGVVAEGIETPAQRAFLSREGCTVGQGYLFSLPLQKECFRALLARGAALPLGEAEGKDLFSQEEKQETINSDAYRWFQAMAGEVEAAKE